jgi:hypothetical protein
MEKELQELKEKLNAISVVYKLIDNKDLKIKLLELSLSLQKQILGEEEDKIESENIYLRYTEERIIKEPTISGSRLKISTIQDDFKEWYSIHYGKTTPEIIKLLREFLVIMFGKYPQNGWGHISLSEEEI